MAELSEDEKQSLDDALSTLYDVYDASSSRRSVWQRANGSIAG